MGGGKEGKRAAEEVLIMFEKHKEKKMRQLREAEKELSAIPVGKPDDNHDMAKILRRKRERRRALIRTILPGMVVTFFLAIAIFFIASPIGEETAILVTIAVLVISNLLMYFYTKRIYIPAGIDFLQFGPEDPDDESSSDLIGAWRVPVGLTGSIRKDIPAPLKAIMVKPVNENEPNPNYYKVIPDEEGEEHSIFYDQSELNRLDTANNDGQIMYQVNSFYWDEDTGEIFITPTIYYGRGDYNTRKYVLDSLQRDLFHLGRAHTQLKMKLPIMVEQRVRELVPSAIKRLLHAKYDDPADSEAQVSDAEEEILDEESKVSKKVIGDGGRKDGQR